MPIRRENAFGRSLSPPGKEKRVHPPLKSAFRRHRWRGWLSAAGWEGWGASGFLREHYLDIGV
jgi:hypothetical protein